MAATPTPVIEPERIVGDRYRVLRLLGRGGMGEVWAARRLSIGDTVALKRLLPGQDTPNNRRRFAIEAQAAAHIRHPNVVQIFDYDDDAEVGPYLIMEMLDGHTLSDELVTRPLDVERARWVFAGVCAAVEAGHRRGIVHRDLKPANVFISRLDDGREQVKVVDFGIALDLGRPEARQITTPGTVVGTSSYLAPELVEGRAASPASDVFALGVVLYEMVTGSRPFVGASPIDIMLAIAGGRYRPARELMPGLPPSVSTAIDAALARDPARRPSSPEALAWMAAGDDTPRPGPAATLETRLPGGDDRAGTQGTGDAAPMFGRFVGRDHELGRLHDEYNAAVDGRGRIVLVTGEAGVGKSRLIEQLTVSVAERGAATLSARFVDPEAGRPPPLDTFAAMLDGELPADGDRWRTFAAIADGIAARAAGRPLLLVLDDLHWASRLDLDVIAHLHRALGPRGALILGAARPFEAGRGGRDELAAWRADRAATVSELPLAPFDEDDLRAWLDGVFRAFDAGPVDLRRLLRATGGNPYALGETLRHLVAQGAIARGDHGWRLEPSTELELPDGVAQLWRVRLTELLPAHRQVLEVAAVLGDELRFDVLAAAGATTFGLDEAALDAAIDVAFARRLLTDRGVAAGHDARFTSAPVRDVLLADLAPRARRRAHLAAIDALTRTLGADRAAHALVHHLHAVGDWPATVHAGVRASTAARARFDLDAAVAALDRAEDAVGRAAADGVTIDPRDLAALDHQAGAIALAEGSLDAAVTRLGRAAATAASLDEPALRIDARSDLARAHLARGEHDAAIAEAAGAAGEAEALGDRIRALTARAIAADVAVRGGGGVLHLDLLIADLGERDPAALRSRVHRGRAWARLKKGDWTGAADDARHALDLARAAGDLAAQQLALAALSAIRNESGSPATAVDSARESLALARRLGDRRREGICMANLADTLLGADALDEAHDLLRGALAIFTAIGDDACEGDCRVNLGRALLALGRRAEALPVLERGAALCATTGRREFEGVAHLYLGDADLTTDPARALDAYRRAADILVSMDSHQRWRAELGAARACHLLHDPATSAVHAGHARAHLESLRARLAAGQDASVFQRALADAARLADDLTEVSEDTRST